MVQDLQEKLEKEDTGLTAAKEGIKKSRTKVATLEAEMRDVEGAKARKLKVSHSLFFWCNRGMLCAHLTAGTFQALCVCMVGWRAHCMCLYLVCAL